MFSALLNTDWRSVFKVERLLMNCRGILYKYIFICFTFTFCFNFRDRMFMESSGWWPHWEPCLYLLWWRKVLGNADESLLKGQINKTWKCGIFWEIHKRSKQNIFMGACKLKNVTKKGYAFDDEKAQDIYRNLKSKKLWLYFQIHLIPSTG